MRLAGLLVVLIGASACTSRSGAESQGVNQTEDERPSIVGVWKPVEVGGAATSHSPEEVGSEARAAGPGLRIFTSGYYTFLGVVNTPTPRVAPPAVNPTVEQLLAAWGPFGASGGPYEIAGDTIVMHTIVAKNPFGGAERVDRFTFRVTADSLWVTGIRSGLTEKYVRLEG